MGIYGISGYIWNQWVYMGSVILKVIQNQKGVHVHISVGER